MPTTGVMGTNSPKLDRRFIWSNVDKKCPAQTYSCTPGKIPTWTRHCKKSRALHHRVPSLHSIRRLDGNGPLAAFDFRPELTSSLAVRVPVNLASLVGAGIGSGCGRRGFVRAENAGVAAWGSVDIQVKSDIFLEKRREKLIFSFSCLRHFLPRFQSFQRRPKDFSF